MAISTPKYLKDIEIKVAHALKHINKPNGEIHETQQLYHDKILAIYQEAFQNIIDNTVTLSKILDDIKNTYEAALQIRDNRIKQFTIQDKVFGISERKKERDDQMLILEKQNGELKTHNSELTLEISKLKKEMGKLKDENFSDYLELMRERDARYTLYYENLALQLKVKELDGSRYPVDLTYGDPMMLRIALDKCREQLSLSQRALCRARAAYADAVPRRQHAALLAAHRATSDSLRDVSAALDELQAKYDKLAAKKKSLEEELSEVKDRCRELERAGTPRPHWDMCADFIGGGKDRWWQLARGLSSRDILRVLLKELGPAAESEHLEYFDGLGTAASVPAYLRHAGRVRDLRLPRRALVLLVHDIWASKSSRRDMDMQDYLAQYFEERYGQSSARLEWAYNVRFGAEQMLEEPSARLLLGALHGAIDERVYWALWDGWRALRGALGAAAGGGETVTIEEFERVVRATFPLKSELDVKNLTDVVRKQLKLKFNQNDINIDNLFDESAGGLDRLELWRELYRQRQAAQDRYIRELVGALGAAPRAARPRPDVLVTEDALKRAFAVVDPAIDHVRMERYTRWALGDAGALPLRRVAARLAAGDIQRAGARHRAARRARPRPPH